MVIESQEMVAPFKQLSTTLMQADQTQSSEFYPNQGV